MAPVHGTVQQTRDIDPMLVQCWSTVYDAGPTLGQHWVDVSRLLGGAVWGLGWAAGRNGITSHDHALVSPPERVVTLSLSTLLEVVADLHLAWSRTPTRR